MPFHRYNVPDIRQDGPKLEVEVMLPEALVEVLLSTRCAVPPPQVVPALIDTGAESSVAVEEVIDALGLEPTGFAVINTPFVCRARVAQYHVRIALPHGPELETDQLVMAPLGVANVKLLIGRDLLSQCLLVYNGQDESFTLST